MKTGAPVHSHEEVGGQGLGGLAFFAVLLRASLVAKALNRDRNGQAMARTKHGSQLLEGWGGSTLNGGQEAGQRSLYFSPNSCIFSCRQSGVIQDCHRVK